MTTFLPLIYDAIVLVIIFIFIQRTMRAGLISSLIRTLGYLISIVVSLFGSRFLANSIFQLFFKDNMVTSINQAVGDIASVPQLTEGINKSLEVVPSFIANFITSSVGTTEDIVTSIRSFVLEQSHTLGEVITTTYVQPVIVGILQIVLAIVLFAVCTMLVRVVAQLFKGVRHIPLIGGVNRLLGGVIGILQSVIILYLVATIISLILSVTPGGFAYLNQDIIADTYLFRYFFHYNVMELPLA